MPIITPKEGEEPLLNKAKKTNGGNAFDEGAVKSAALWLKRRIQAYSRFDGFHKMQVIPVAEALPLLKEAFADVFPKEEAPAKKESDENSENAENK